VGVLVSARADADDRAACLDASSKGQTLRDDHKLIEARDQFRICAEQQCPAVVQRDCATWLEAIEKSIPTVVIGAQDSSGSDVVDVKVTVDGKPLVSKLDGRAIPLDAGPHSFHFEFPDGTLLDQNVLVREGEQNQSVLGAQKRAPGAAQIATGPGAAAPSTHGTNSLKVVGWVLGGLGVAGVATGSVFGVVAMNDKNGAKCVDNKCDAGPLSAARTAALVADIGIIGGGVLLASGAAILLLTPSAGHESAAMTLGPAIGANQAGLLLNGRW
jgi:hypothetical protein